MTQNNSDNNGKSSKNKNPCKNQIRKFKKQIAELEERLEFSISKEASRLIDEAIAEEYPEIWTLFNHL